MLNSNAKKQYRHFILLSIFVAVLPVCVGEVFAAESTSYRLYDRQPNDATGQLHVATNYQMNSNGITWVEKPLTSTSYQVVVSRKSSSSSSSSSSSAAEASTSSVQIDRGGGRRTTERVRRTFEHRSAPEEFIRFKPMPFWGQLLPEEETSYGIKRERRSRGILDRYKLRRWQDIIPDYIVPTILRFAAPELRSLRRIRFTPLEGISIPSYRSDEYVRPLNKRRQLYDSTTEVRPWFIDVQGNPLSSIQEILYAIPEIEQEDQVMHGAADTKSGRWNWLLLLLLIAIAFIAYEVHNSKSQSKSQSKSKAKAQSKSKIKSQSKRRGK